MVTCDTGTLILRGNNNVDINRNSLPLIAKSDAPKTPEMSLLGKIYMYTFKSLHVVFVPHVNTVFDTHYLAGKDDYLFSFIFLMTSKSRSTLTFCDDHNSIF